MQIQTLADHFLFGPLTLIAIRIVLSEMDFSPGSCLAKEFP